MKLRIIPIFTMLTALILLSCVPTSQVVNVNISCDQFAQNNHQVLNFLVNVGDKINIKLCSNPTTGFQWECEMGGENVLNEPDHYFEEPGGDVPGTAGIEVWTFQAIGSGRTEVRMAYSQLWEGGEKEEWTYTMTVTVR